MIKTKNKISKILVLSGCSTLVAVFSMLSCGKDSKQTGGSKGPVAGGQSTAMTVALTWDPPADPENITSYAVYVVDGRNATAKPSRVKTIKTSDSKFDAESPSIELGAETEPAIEELIGKRACFSVTSINKEGTESDPSSQTCANL